MRRPHTKQNGFSLIEVVIAMIISSIALLGLASGQLKSLQYANNSFHYTTSLIHANNVLERVWNDICQLQDGTRPYNANYIATLQPPAGYELDLTGISPGTFSREFKVTISWVDERMTDSLDNSMAIDADYPLLPGGCSV